MPEAHIEIEAEDGHIDAFAACPDGPGPWPPVLLLSDSRGLRPAVEAMARRLAAHGVFVLAPNLFHRSDPAPDEAHHLAACVNAVLHLGHAEDGPGPGALEAALRREGVDFESLVYAGPRGFAVPDHPGYAPQAAERHWENLLELFQRTLGLSNSDPKGPPGPSGGGISSQEPHRPLL